jgi:trimeric autotransporter adhesin
MAIIECLQRSARSIVCLGLLGTSTLSFAAASQPQITQPIDNQNRVVLKGNVRPMPQRARDLGAVAATTPASRMLLLLKRPAEQEAALQEYIASAHMQGSANYHHWLTPAQIGSQFGPADSDVQAVVAWLQSQGFAVAKVSAAKTTIEFSGTAGQIESAFATKIHSFQVDGVDHVSNVSDPQIPAALAPVIAGISPLNDFHPKPMHTAPQGRVAIPAPTSANPKAMTSLPRSGGLQPDLTVSTSTGTPFYAVAPADFATIYDTPNSTLNSKYSGTNLTGSGVTIGIAGDSNIDGLGSGSNVANYRSIFGLPAISSGSKVVVDGNDPGTGSDDEVEALLDLEVASAVAPSANLILYISQDTTFQSGLDLAIQRALDDNTVNILNVSFGLCEAYQGQSGNQEILNFWEQAAAQGISVTVSTGDDGSAGCDDNNTETAAVQGLQVNSIASTPFNIAVGGTDFNQSSSNESTYWNSTNSSIGGSAKGPIPEIPWNDSTSTDGALSGNTPVKDSNGNTNIVGAGGGVSACLNALVDPSTDNVVSCGAVSGSLYSGGGYAKPTWQSSFGSTANRELPDVSLFAADGLHDSAWVLCATGVGASTSGTDCQPDSTGNYSFQVVGGTSASSPAFGGVLALVIQQLGGGRLGQADYTLYPLSQQKSAAFHDVTTGNNAVYCLSGAADCGSNGFLTGYNAATGYDDASGLGSLDVTQLVQNWSSITFKPTTTSLTVNGATSPITITHGSAVSIGVTVTSSGGTPTGNVALVAGSGTNNTSVPAVEASLASPAILPLSNGTATNSSYKYLPGGTYGLTANYGGDGTFASSTSSPPISVTVNPEASTLELSIQDFNSSTGAGSTVTSVVYGTYVSIAAEPVSTAEASQQNLTYLQQATGTVTFTSSPAIPTFIPTTPVPVNSNGFAEIPNQLSIAYPPGTYSVSASYSGDASFSSSTAGAQAFTVTKNNVTISAANGSTSTTVVVQVAPAAISGFYSSSGLLLPSGTVTLTNSSGATVGTGTLANITNPVTNTAIAQATITVSGTATTVSYAGDTNYNAGSASFTPSTGSFTLSAAPSTVSISSGGSGTTTMNITPASGFTGTVNVSCSAGSSPLTCSLAQSSVAVSGTAAVTDVLTVTSTSSSGLRIPANPLDRWYAAGGVALAGVLLFGLPGRRRAWQRMLSLLLLFIAVGVVGCGGGGSSNNNTSTYTVTVTATSGTLSQSSNVTVTVQ